jgi:hypothetical protein
MKELSLSFGHFKREDELPLTIIVNGCTYQSQPLVDATKKTYFDMGKEEATLEKVDQFNKGYEIGKYEGYEAGKKSNGYSSDDIKQLHTDYSHIHHLWFDKGYIVGKSAGYKEGYDAASIKYFDEYSVKMEEKSKSRYDAGYNDGYEQCKHDGISTKEIPGEYLSHIEEARLEGYAEGYSDCREKTEHIMEYGRDEDGVE